MESLLHLVWLALSVPALLLWRRARKSARESEQVCRTNPLVLVGCLLLLLFPVVSATDDLLALGLEMDESGATKRLVKQSAEPKAPMAGDGFGAPAQLYGAATFTPDNRLRQTVSTYVTVPPKYDPTSASGCRAPPWPKFSACAAPSRTARTFFKLDFILRTR